MKLTQHSYFHAGMRIPKPENLELSREKLIISCVPWGHRDNMSSYLQKLADFFVAAKDDAEATSPFPRYPQYSNSLNNLQIAMQVVNDNIFKQKNQDELQSGLEIIACYRDNNEFGWVSYGGPNIILWKQSGEIRLLHHANNLASHRKQNCSPLPKNMLGVYRSIHPHIESIHLDEGDKVFLLYCSRLNPFHIESLNTSERSLTSLVNQLFEKNSQESFWLAEVELAV
ncbi:MAG: hypothetical protein VX642_00790 [Bdellovibrionota bacterium]|nr:hypothetical protein [Bdellovibrionota bacterium]